VCDHDGAHAGEMHNVRLHRTGNSALQAKAQRLRDVTCFDVRHHVIAMMARGDYASGAHLPSALDRAQSGTGVWKEEWEGGRVEGLLP
jgi:hypothetical protein